MGWTLTYNLDINGEDALYMEIDRYNSIDEIYPYSERTGHLYNNDLGHRVNGSFAKNSFNPHIHSDKKWVPEIILSLTCFIVTHLFKELIGLNLYLDFMMADLLILKIYLSVLH